MVEELVVVGASLAGLKAAEAARRHGFAGRLTLVGDEVHLPYDRPPLSKEHLGAVEEVAPTMLATAEHLADLDIRMRLGAPATGLDVDGHRVLVGDEAIGYDRVLLATGASPRRLPGTEGIAGVVTLRTLDDAIAVRSAFDRGLRTVVIGAGFIGSEIASAAVKRGVDVTVIEAAPTPLVRAVGETAGEALSALHERNGARLRCGIGVDGIESADGCATGVRLATGEVVPAELVVVGIGVAPATGWLEGSGLAIENGVVADENLQAAPDVFAAGDVARWMSPDFGVLLRLEHWTNAVDMAAHAARNMLGDGPLEPYHHIPYFWSDWYAHRIQFAGLATGEPTLVLGGWGDDEFAALYRDGDRLVGVLTLNRRADIMKYRALIARGASWEEALAFAASRRKAPIPA